MDKKKIDELKEKLEKEKNLLKTELQKFAQEDKKLKGDWDTKYPQSNGGVGSQQMEDAADQVEEYSTLLPIEHNLELRLQDIELALEKIKKGTYGKCEKCGKEIKEERLEFYPEAKLCSDCQK
jgi:RNA polymerase-binding transcription factor DksA